MRQSIEKYRLEELTPSVYAYVHPYGPWGVNNAGLVCGDDGTSMLIDTLFTVGLTGQMVDAMCRATDAARQISVVLNTHANGDHCWGNRLFDQASIVSTEAAAAEMTKVTPAIMNKLMTVARLGVRAGGLREPLSKLFYRVGATTFGAIIGASCYLTDIFGRFDFSGIEAAFPNRTFSGSLTLSIGNKEVVLTEVGSAHTQGDCFVFVPEDRVLFAGDLLFIGGHPVLWEGPVANWIDACDKMLALDAACVVPGHGPLTDHSGIRLNRDYLTHIAEESRKRFDAGIPVERAAQEIDMGGFSDLSEPERLVLNVDTLYREFRGDPPRTSVIPCFDMMAKFREKLMQGA